MPQTPEQTAQLQSLLFPQQCQWSFYNDPVILSDETYRRHPRPPGWISPVTAAALEAGPPERYTNFAQIFQAPGFDPGANLGELRYQVDQTGNKQYVPWSKADIKDWVLNAIIGKEAY